MIGISTHHSPNVKLPFLFMVTGVVLYVVLNIFMFLAIPSLAAGAYRLPSIWAITHLTVLGFAVMTAMGAMYQLISVALIIPIYSEKLGFTQFFVYAIGTIGLLFGFSTMQLPILITFGTLTFLGIVLFVYNMYRTIFAMEKQFYISDFVLSAVSYLFLTVLLGLTFVLNLKYHFLGSFQTRLYYVHLLVGLFGWFTFLISGFSYKMAPMFALSHGFKEKLPRIIFKLYHGGMAVAIIGCLSASRIVIVLGLLILLAGYCLFIRHLKDIVKHKMKRRLDVGLRTSLNAVWFGVAALILFILDISFGIANSSIHLAFVYLFIMGWICLSITGYMYKIVPFLWWTKKYSTVMGKKKVPQLKDLISEKWGDWVFPIMTFAIAGFGISLALHTSVLLYFFQVFILLSSIGFTGAVLNVFRR